MIEIGPDSNGGGNMQNYTIRAVEDPPTSQESPQDRPPASVDEILDRWRASMLAAGRNPRTLDQQESRVRHLVAHAGVDDLSAIHAEHALEWFAEVSRNGMPRRKGAGGRRKIEGISPQARRNHAAGMRAFWSWLQRAELVPAGPNPWDAIVLPAKTHKQRRAFTLEETAAIISAAEADEESDTPRCRWSDGEVVHRSSLYWTLATTGIRIGTAERIRWRDVALDRETPTMTVRGLQGSKEPEDRVEVLPEPTARALARWRSLAPDPAPPAFIWKRPRADVLASDLEAGGVAKTDGLGRSVGFHGFRRYLATQLVRNGEPHSVTAKALNHRNFSTTNKHYVDASLVECTQPLERVAEQIRRTQADQKQRNHATNWQQRERKADTLSGADGLRGQESRQATPPSHGTDTEGGDSRERGRDPPGEKGPDRPRNASLTGSSPVTPIDKTARTASDAEILQALAEIMQAIGQIQTLIARRIAEPPGGSRDPDHDR